MKICIYRYKNHHGKSRLGHYQAETLLSCYQALAANGIIPIWLKSIEIPSFFSKRKLKASFLIFFFRQLAIALKSGVPLLDALHYIGKEQTNKQQTAFVDRIEKGILSGQTFSSVLQETAVLETFFIQWIRIGEKQGRLEIIFSDISDYMEKREESKKKLLGQLFYPFVVLCAVILVGALLFFVILPILAEQFVGMDTPLPLMLRVPLLVHDVLTRYYWLLIGILMLCIGGLSLVLIDNDKRQHFKRKIQGVFLKLSVTRKLAILMVYVPFARLFGQLLSSGVPIHDALYEVERYFSYSFYAQEIQHIQEKMVRGLPLSQAIHELSFVPDMAHQMIVYSEKVGRLPETLIQSASYYEMVVMNQLSLWMKCIEPLAIMLLGLMVLLVALGLFVPVLESYQIVLQQ